MKAIGFGILTFVGLYILIAAFVGIIIGFSNNETTPSEFRVLGKANLVASALVALAVTLITW